MCIYSTVVIKWVEILYVDKKIIFTTINIMSSVYDGTISSSGNKMGLILDVVIIVC